MSQALASAPRAARALRRPAVAVGPRLQLLVSPVENAQRIPFLVTCVAVCLLGLFALLGLNISLSKGSYQVFLLQKEQTRLVETEQALAEQVAIEQSPASVSAKARALGMVPSTSPVFLRLADGQIIGDAEKAGTAALPASAELPTAGDTDPRVAQRQQVATERALQLHRAMERATIGTAGTALGVLDSGVPEPPPAANAGQGGSRGNNAQNIPRAGDSVPATAAQRGDGAVPIGATRN